MSESALIGHIAVGSGLATDDPRVWDRFIDGDERPITDHAGCSLTLTAPTGA